MKQVVLSIGLTLIIRSIFACSCEPYEPNFYKNISDNNLNCIAVCDTTNRDFVYQGLSGQTAYFIIIDALNIVGNSVGDTIVVTGQDGLNCGESVSNFQSGDTMVLSMTRGFYYNFEKDTFYLEGACGKYYLKITNGQNSGLSISEIKDKIESVLSKSDLACKCYGLLDSYDFYNNVSSQTSNCLAIFHKFDYGYQYNGLKSQTGYFILIDTIGDFNSQIGDTIIVTGEDGINCGEMLNRFSSGDTLFMALTSGYYENFTKDTFYLKGGTCGYYYLKITNGQNNGSSISEIRDKIQSIITGTELNVSQVDIKLYPNPTTRFLSISTSEALIKRIQFLDMKGSIILDYKSINCAYFECDITNISSGLYNLKIYTDKGLINRRILKN
jgi:hypothetical protein